MKIHCLNAPICFIRYVKIPNGYQIGGWRNGKLPWALFTSPSFYTQNLWHSKRKITNIKGLVWFSANVQWMHMQRQLFAKVCANKQKSELIHSAHPSHALHFLQECLPFHNSTDLPQLLHITVPMVPQLWLGCFHLNWGLFSASGLLLWSYEPFELIWASFCSNVLTRTLLCRTESLCVHTCMASCNKYMMLTYSYK